MESLVSLKNERDDFAVEFDVLPPAGISVTEEERQVSVNAKLQKIETELADIQDRLAVLNTDIDKLTNHADGLDYMVAAGSGVLAGMIDIFFAGEFSLENANQWGKEKTNNFVVSVAQNQGYKGDDIEGAILYLAEKKKHKGGQTSGYHLASDSVTSHFGGGTQHHLRDFAHHPTLVGLMFSMLTQFTGKAYGTDTAGRFLAVEIKNREFIGNDLPHKILYGVIFWGFHIISDMAGSGGTISGGTGLPGPIVSALKEISVLPFFRNIRADDMQFSQWISKLFNGTLLGKRGENGKPIPLKFDLRTEIGIAHEIGKQTVPVIINECVVRGFYFIRRFYMELKNNDVQSFKEIERMNWENTLPFKNRTVIRMLTISTGTMAAIDMADAAIGSAVKSGGVTPPLFLSNMIIRVNFVGVGRFAFAVGSDVRMGVKKGKLTKERIQLYEQQMALLNAKVFYKQENMWIAAKGAGETIEQAYEIMEKATIYYRDSLKEMTEDMEQIQNDIPRAGEKNPGLLEEINDILTWE